MLKNNASRPLYLQIQDILLKEIQAGVYDVGGKLPSERELAERFKVSRMTARQALQSLHQHGLVYAQVGKGTFVRQAAFKQGLESLSSFTEDIRALGQVPRSQILLAQVLPADEIVAERLQLALHSPVCVLKRLRFANQQPLAIETAHLPHVSCPGLLDRHDFTRESLYRILQEVYGIRLAYAEQTFRADLADSTERRLLNMADGTPPIVLRVARVTFDSADQPIEYVSSAYHGAHYEFQVSLRAVRAQVVLP
ncbi:MAG: GntR family transcriptional regulator [Aggregatilineales bacterium]